ncbi:hypothetical protein [Fusobacterium varium]|uniref:hypothetical protein n=1 Tax=Fusobacterium varium TaxID=856 RepID=UPI0024200783|nr:hypothetical protein [Fusobacterium varium]
MKCHYCDEEIKDSEEFFEKDGEFYCNQCCKELMTTYYQIGNDQNYDEDEIKKFDDKKDAVIYLERQFESTKETIEKLKVSDKPYAKHYIEMEEKNKVRLEETLKVLKGEEE